MAHVEKEERTSNVLVIGGIGHIGKHIVVGSVSSGHSTSVLVRDVAPSNPAKAKLLGTFIDSGVSHHDLLDHESLVNAIRGADVVISAMGPHQLAEQTRIVAVIKEASVGAINRFLPSEFGSDVDRVHAVDSVASLMA